MRFQETKTVWNLKALFTILLIIFSVSLLFGTMLYIATGVWFFLFALPLVSVIYAFGITYPNYRDYKKKSSVHAQDKDESQT